MRKILFLIYQKIVNSFTGTNISKYRIIQKIVMWINSKLKPNFVEIDGNKIYLDEKDSLFLSVYGVHEKTETQNSRNSINFNIFLEIDSLPAIIKINKALNKKNTPTKEGKN